MPFVARKTAASRLLLLGIAIVAAACSGPHGDPTLGPTPPGTGGAPASPAGSAPVGAPSGGSTPMVDLTFTGTFAFTAKGTAGRCILISGMDGKVFGFEGTEADYPGLGQSFSMAELNGIVDIKWVRDDATSWGNNPSATITLTADHHGVSVDQDLARFTTASGSTAGPEHVAGTITCP